MANNSITETNASSSYLPLYQCLVINKNETTKHVYEIGFYQNGSIRMWGNCCTPNAVYNINTIDNECLCILHKNNCINIHFTFSNAYNNNYVHNHIINNNINLNPIIDNDSHALESMRQFIKLYSQIFESDGILIIEDVKSIDWVDILREAVPNYLKEFIKVYDLRVSTNRYDNILFIIDRHNIYNI